MSWFVVVPAAWFGIALVLGLLVGRCLRVEGIGQPAVHVADGAAVPTATDAPSPSDDSHSALSPALAHTV
jgi:hypothetical protein